jgi:hypothetical protein
VPGEDAPPPGLIATIGLHGSASTWVFNVVRELMIAALGEQRVVAVYADKVEDVPDAAGRCLVVKSHHGSAGLDAWLATAWATIFLSLRDARDAAMSMAQRFNAPLNQAVHWIADDCARMMRLAAQGHLLLRYEDRFFEDAAFADLPPGRVVSAGRIVMDPVTQIHRIHIGDGRSGKWRDLPGPVQAKLTRFFRPFLDRWGYPG